MLCGLFVPWRGVMSCHLFVPRRGVVLCGLFVPWREVVLCSATYMLSPKLSYILLKFGMNPSSLEDVGQNVVLFR